MVIFYIYFLGFEFWKCYIGLLQKYWYFGLRIFVEVKYFLQNIFVEILVDVHPLILIYFLVGEALEYCCESQVKVEGNETVLPIIEEVLVPDKLMPVLNVGKKSLKLKPNVDLSKYERLFSLDESLKPVSINISAY